MMNQLSLLKSSNDLRELMFMITDIYHLQLFSFGLTPVLGICVWSHEICG